jgi:hypothetical protein
VTKPFRPPRGITVETPYRISVLRADPDFEYAKRHEPFYEFSNGRRFNEDTSRHGAYLVVRQDNDVPLSSPGLTGRAGNVAGQGAAGISANLSGVSAQALLGALGFTNVKAVALNGLAAVGNAGNITLAPVSQPAAPVLTLTSAPNVANPTFTFTLDPTIVAGNTIRFQEQVAGGDWSSPVADVTHVLTSGEISTLSVDLSSLSRTNGNYESRILANNGLLDSPWSNVVSFVVLLAPVILTGVAGIGAAGSIKTNFSVRGVAAVGSVGTITAQIGSTSVSKNLTGLTAIGQIGVINQGQLQQPVMTLTTAAGDPNPDFTFTLDAAIVAGDTMTFQEQVAGGNWSSPIVNVTHTFTAPEIAALDVNLALAARTTGSYEARMLVTHGAVNSAWSNTVPFTVSVASSGTPFGLLLAITK